MSRLTDVLLGDRHPNIDADLLPPSNTQHYQTKVLIKFPKVFVEIDELTKHLKESELLPKRGFGCTMIVFQCE